jgi:glycosyltransferase involved in cell wall biosynthesis
VNDLGSAPQAIITRPEIHLVAIGTSATLTGIERMLVRHVCDLVEAPWFRDADGVVIVHVDDHARWASELPATSVVEVRRHRRRRGGLVRGVGRRTTAGASIVHSFGPRVARTSRAPVIYTVFDWRPFNDPTLATRARVLWRAAMVAGVRAASDVVTYRSEILRNPPRLLRGAIERKGLLVAAPAVRLSPAFPHGTALPDPGFLLFVGSNQPHKRVDLLCAAVAQTPFRLVLAGDGTERLVGPQVEGLGRVPDAELDELYDRAAAVVLPSAVEGYGWPVVEAAAHRTKAIVSREVARLHNDYLGDSLIEIECSSIEALAGGLRRLADHPEILAELPATPLPEASLPLDRIYKRLLTAERSPGAGAAFG